MNQEQQQQENRTLRKARLIAETKRVRRSPVEESRNIWLVGCLQSLRIFCSRRAAFTSLLWTHLCLQAKSLNLDQNLAVTVGGGFFGGILIGYALKKIIKIVAIIAGFFLAALAYLQYQQIANINWHRIQAISEDTLTSLANATQQIPGFDGNDNVPGEFVMTNLGIPLTGSLAIGFTIGFMRG